MDTLKKNKEFIVRYINAISGKAKTPELVDQFVSDPKLKGHIQFFEGAFPRYELIIDEMMAEGNRVLVRARSLGKHEGEIAGIPATHRSIEMPFVMSYEVENEKIIDHWAIADQMSLMEQLGAVSQPVEK